MWNIQVFHKYVKLTMLALLPTLHSHFLQFSLLFALTDVSKCEVGNLGVFEDCIWSIYIVWDLLVLNGRGKTKLTILVFLYWEEFVKKFFTSSNHFHQIHGLQRVSDDWWLVESYLIDGNGVASWLFWEFLHATLNVLFSHEGEHSRRDWTQERWDWNEPWKQKVGRGRLDLHKSSN